MQKVTHIPRYTYSDYEKWKDDWELIDGFPWSKSTSGSAIHQTVSGELLFQIKNELNTQPCFDQCFVYNELDWIIDDQNVVRPDVSVICGESVKKFIEKAPVLIIEIISESSAYRDKIVKKELYESQGVKYYIIANPKTKSIEAFELINNIYKVCLKSVFNFSETCYVILDYAKIWQML